MAPDSRPSHWDELPDEILLQIISYLEPYHVTRLQLVSKRLQKFCLDDDMWKRNCFQDSSWYRSLNLRRKQAEIMEERLRKAAPLGSLDDAAAGPASSADDFDEVRRRRWQRIQDTANWDPAFPDERVSWYDEYIQRNGPASINWFQMPHIRDREMEAIIEARGMALFNPYDGNDGADTMLAVSPLDDGSICLWDIRGTKGKQGGILARSKPDILFIDGPSEQNSRRSKRIDAGVTECVSVSQQSNRAFFAVQSHLIEVDLNRLEVVARESFEWSITTLSQIHEGLPLTVGTSLGIHLHDFRMRSNIIKDASEKVEPEEQNLFKSIFDPTPLPPYASLSQPTPLSILHLPRPGMHNGVSDDIYVSGRFTNILHYDRRKFPAIMGSIYSGAQVIPSLTALPFPFSSLDSQLRQQGELSVEQIQQSKQGTEGCTLIAAGSYKNKGSLEIYGLSFPSDVYSHSLLQNSVTKNRYTAASSSILSVTTHGTKIVFSDGSGLLKWFERDGVTEICAHRVGSCFKEDKSLFVGPHGVGELARKIVSTKSTSNNRPNSDNVVFWTGERVGMLSFTSKPLFTGSDFSEMEPDEVEEERKREEYSDQMREALQKQADEIQLMGAFGHAATGL